MLVLCFEALVPMIVIPGGWSWLQQHRFPAAVLGAYAAVAALAGIWLMVRLLRMGIRFDDRGITVRNPLRTHRISWPQVSLLADGSYLNLNDGRHWALMVVLRNGKSVTAGWLVNGAEARPETVDLIKQCAARYGISAQLTGNPYKPYL